MPVAVMLIFWMFGKSFWKSLEQGRKRILESKAWKRATGRLPREPANIELDDVPSMTATRKGFSTPFRRIRKRLEDSETVRRRVE